MDSYGKFNSSLPFEHHRAIFKQSAPGKTQKQHLSPEEVSGVSFASESFWNLEVFQGPLADSGTPALKALLQLGGLRVGESWGSRCWGLQFYGFHWAWFFMRSADGVWWWWLPPWNSLKNSQVLNSYKVWLVGGFKYFLVCTPKIGEDEPILTIIFFR